MPGTAQAYSLSLLVVPPGSMFFPWLSTLNDLNGWVVANAALAPAGTNGAVSANVYSNSGLVIDLNGYFAP